MPTNSRPQIDTTYAWRLLAEEVGPGVGPTTPSCNVSFSPASLHATASILAAGSSVSPLVPSAASAALRRLLLSFLAANGFPPGLPSKAASSAISAAVIIDPTEDNKPAAGAGRAYFDNAVWMREYLFVGHNNLSCETGRYGSLLDLHDDFKTKGEEARDKATSWIRERAITPSSIVLIPEGSVHGDTEFIVANALRFFGIWDPQIGLEPGPCSDFYKLNGFKFSVPFMTSKKPQMIACCPGFKTLRLPYHHGKGDNRYAMYIFLPDQRDGLFDLLDKFATEPGFLERHLPTEMVAVGEFKVPVKDGSFASKSVGAIWPCCPYPFRNEEAENGEEGGGDEVDDPTDVPFQPHCFAVLLFIDSNEDEENLKGEGEEIGDVDVDSAGYSSGSAHVEFVADHAFLYAIREDTSGTVLMIGHVHNPLCGNPADKPGCLHLGAEIGHADSDSEENKAGSTKADVEDAKGVDDAGGVAGAGGE